MKKNVYKEKLFMYYELVRSFKNKMSPYDLQEKEYTLTEDIQEELIDLFPFVPDIIERAQKDSYIIELLEERNTEELSNYLENE